MVCKTKLTEDGVLLPPTNLDLAGRRCSGRMLAAVLIASEGLLVTTNTRTAAKLSPATAVAPRLVTPPRAAVQRARCWVRLNEDGDGAGDDAEEPRRSAVLYQRVSDVLFLLSTLAIQAIGAASLVGILLNLSGYGYRLSAERGVEVGTLAEVRSAFAERRFSEGFLDTK